MEIQRGMRDKLENYMDTTKLIEVKLNIVGNAVYDFSCFGVDGDNKLTDDRYMVFYNQTKSPNGEIEYVAGNNCAVFKVMTNSVPAQIQRLVFTVSIDGIGTMGEIAAHSISIGNSGNPAALTANFAGTVFNNEKAIISIELYRKNEWRFSITASGFNGGIQDLLHYFGGTETEEAILKATPEDEEPETPEPQKTASPPPVPPAPPEQPTPPPPPFEQPQPQFGQPQPQFGQPQFGQPQPNFGQPQPQSFPQDSHHSVSRPYLLRRCLTRITATADIQDSLHRNLQEISRRSVSRLLVSPYLLRQWEDSRRSSVVRLCRLLRLHRQIKCRWRRNSAKPLSLCHWQSP